MAKPHILVVEDEFIIRHDIASTFTNAGCVAVEASNADKAIEMLIATPDIHMVFSDIRMPGELNGIGLAQYIKARWPAIRVILSSGNNNERPDGLPDDVEFLPKPVSIEKLVSLARGICSD